MITHGPIEDSQKKVVLEASEKEKKKELDESSVSSKLNTALLDLSTDSDVDSFIDDFEIVELPFEVEQKKAKRVEKSQKQEAEKEKKKQPVVVEKKQQVVVDDPGNAVQGPSAYLGDRITQLYEKQPLGSNNCYACSAAALYNQHLLKKGQQVPNGGAISQNDFRSYKPRFIDFAEYRRRNPNSTEATFEKEKQTVRQYTRTESREQGNVFALADKFLELDSNLCVNDMTFDLSNITDSKFAKMKTLFLSQVKKVLDTGEAISFYQFSTSHYQTIVGIDGNQIKYLDSTGSNPHEVHVVPVDNFFFKNGKRISLNWLSEKKTPQEMKAEFANLEHDAATGKYSVKHLELPNNDIAHTHGIDVQKTTTEKDDLHFDPEIRDLVSLGIYIPQGDNIVHQDRPAEDDYDVIVSKDNVTQVTTITRKIPKEMIGHLQLPDGIQIDPQVLQALQPVQVDANHQEQEKPKTKEDKAPQGDQDQEQEKKEKEKKPEPENPGQAKKVQEVNPSAPQYIGGGEILVHQSADMQTNVIKRVVVVDRQLARQEQLQPKEQSAEKKEQESAKAINIPEKTYDLVKELEFRASTLVFTEGYDTKGRSASFMALREAADASRELIGSITAGFFTLTEENYAKYMRLYTAAMRYINEHQSPKSREGKLRLEAAEKMRDAMKRVAKKILKDSGNPMDTLPKVTYSKEEKRYADDNIKRLKEYYRQYCQKIDEDLVASDDEKLMRKWDVLKCNERDIQIYFAARKEKDLGSEDKFLMNEYNTIKAHVQLRDRIKGISKQNDSMNKDDKLTEKQIQALSRLDTWIVRNTRNGGFLGMFDAAISDRTDIASKILSMSRRQRLYMYYLVETRERVEPTMDGFIKSQTEYIPDLDKFKDRMIATKLKVHLRVSGSYVYWNKLTEAMAIVNRSAPVMATAEQFFSEYDPLTATKTSKSKTAAKPKTDKKEEKKEADQKDVFTQPREYMEQLLKNGLEAMSLIRYNEENKKSKDRQVKQRITANTARLAQLQQEGKNISTNLSDAIKALQAEKAKAYSKKDDYKLAFSEVPGHAASDVKIVWSAFDNFYKMSNNLKTWPSVYSGGTASLNMISHSVGIVFSIMALYDNSMAMSNIDLAIGAANLGLAIEKTAMDVTNLVGAITSSATIKTIAPAAGLAFAAVESGVAIMKTGSLIRNSYYRHQVGKVQEGMNLSEEEEKFRQGMIRLNAKIGKRQGVSTGGAAVKAIVSTTAAALIVASVATAGVTAIAGGIALLVSWAFDAADRKLARDIKLELFDSYFNTEEEVEKVKADFRKRNGRDMNEKDKKDVVMQVRGRIAAKNNFYSPYSASKFVAGKYADYILDHAQNGPNEQLYVNMIKALGLRFVYDKNHPGGNVPTITDIVKKIAG